MKEYLILFDNMYSGYATYKIIKEHSIKDVIYRLYCEVVGLPSTAFQKAYASMDNDILRIEFINLFLNDKVKDIIEYMPTDIALSLSEKKEEDNNA